MQSGLLPFPASRWATPHRHATGSHTAVQDKRRLVGPCPEERSQPARLRAWPANCLSPFSSMIFTPKDLAFASLEPGSAPRMR
jgi:hypothetical protein